MSNVIGMSPAVLFVRTKDMELPREYLDRVVTLLQEHNVSIKEYLNIVINFSVTKGGQSDPKLILKHLAGIDELRKRSDFVSWTKEIEVSEFIPYPDS